MNDWLIARVSEHEFWITRIDGAQDRPTDYLCGYCDGPCAHQVTAFFASSRGSRGTVACGICERCDQVLEGGALAPSALDDQVEYVLATAGRWCKPFPPREAL